MEAGQAKLLRLSISQPSQGSEPPCGGPPQPHFCGQLGSVDTANSGPSVTNHLGGGTGCMPPEDHSHSTAPLSTSYTDEGRADRAADPPG